jgi:hypothetical protein
MILTCNVVEEGSFGMALTCTLRLMYILRTGQGPSCSTIHRFRISGTCLPPESGSQPPPQVAPPPDQLAAWRREPLCARNREARRGSRLPASAACPCVCKSVPALYSARGRADARNKRPNHHVRLLQDLGVLSGDNECHETIFVPEQHNACWGVQWLSKLAPPTNQAAANNLSAPPALLLRRRSLRAFATYRAVALNTLVFYCRYSVYCCCFPLPFVIVTRYHYWHLPSTLIYPSAAPSRCIPCIRALRIIAHHHRQRPGSALYSCHR